jgi:hypothetical protein
MPLSLVLLAGVFVIACSSNSAAPAHGGPSPDGGGAEGGASSGGASSLGGASSAGGASGAGVGGSIQDVPCAGAICKPLADQSIESRACCTDAMLCGYRLPISGRCLGTKEPGTINPVCPDFALGGKVSFPGCCSPTGCGALVTIGGIGCVDRTELGLPHLDCVFDTIHHAGDGGPEASTPVDGGDADGRAP